MFSGKPKSPSVEMGQGEARGNEQIWAEMVAGKKIAKPKMTSEGIIDSMGISPESIEHGYIGKTPFRNELTAEQVSPIDASAGAKKDEILESMRGRIEKYFFQSKEEK